MQLSHKVIHKPSYHNWGLVHIRLTEIKYTIDYIIDYKLLKCVVLLKSIIKVEDLMSIWLILSPATQLIPRIIPSSGITENAGAIIR